MKYVDPTGEKWWHWLAAELLTGGMVSIATATAVGTAITASADALNSASTSGTIGFISGFFSTGSNRWGAAWDEGSNRAINSIKIYGGIFATDPNKTTEGRAWEFLSRFYWQAPQVTGGYNAAQFTNLFSHTNWVKYKYGATVTNSNVSWIGFTLSSYINGNNTIEADANNKLFQHEYGHYLQSQASGWGYIPRYAIPSVRSEHGNYKNIYKSHDWHPVEQDANRRAFLYFNENVDGFYDKNPYDNHGWNFSENPININGDFQRINVDFHNKNDMLLLDKLTVKAKWYDVVGGALVVPGVIIGYINGYNYNN